MKSITEYLSRVGKARGFGIQSPWAYSFVTDVIGEKHHYYAYADIDRNCTSRKHRKRQRLYYRLSNFVHGSRVYITDINNDADIILQLCRMASPSGIVVIENIHCNNISRKRWHDIRDNELVGVTFDLYDFAICFLDKTMFKQHYKLNF